jgi:hypothetical protein
MERIKKKQTNEIMGGNHRHYRRQKDAGREHRKEEKRGRPRKMRMEAVQAAMTTRNLEPNQWRNREE